MPVSIKLEHVFSRYPFQELTNLVQPDDGSGLIFVTEKRGIIYTLTADLAQQTLNIFLDITNMISLRGSEEGLLGLAFDPEYRENGFFYVYYSAANPGRSIISRYSRDKTDQTVADPRTGLVVMEIEEPFSNHNGGQLAFGPDGYLYVGIGDGGGAGDPGNNGQNLGTLLGKILRIDVRNISPDNGYKIPADNPFAGRMGARGEIWAYGLRNPWRFSFDNSTGLLWAADVGQNKWEEIDIIARGNNYGWNVMEGTHCYSPPTGCDQSGLTLPVFEYDHSNGCSIIGGYVYRGSYIPQLKGFYIYGDYCSGKVWALEGGSVVQNILLLSSGVRITSFGEDLAGNLYVLSQEGNICMLTR